MNDRKKKHTKKKKSTTAVATICTMYFMVNKQHAEITTSTSPVKMSPGFTPLGSFSWLGSAKKYAVECPLPRVDRSRGDSDNDR